LRVSTSTASVPTNHSPAAPPPPPPPTGAGPDEELELDELLLELEDELLEELEELELEDELLEDDPLDDELELLPDDEDELLELAIPGRETLPDARMAPACVFKKSLPSVYTSLV